MSATRQLAALIARVLDDRMFTGGTDLLDRTVQEELAADLAQALTANGYTHTGNAGEPLPLDELAEVERVHDQDRFGDDEPTCRECGSSWPCQTLLAAQGRPTVPCTSCRNADFEGDDIRSLPNPSARHAVCADILQPTA